MASPRLIMSRKVNVFEIRCLGFGKGAGIPLEPTRIGNGLQVNKRGETFFRLVEIGSIL